MSEHLREAEDTRNTFQRAGDVIAALGLDIDRLGMTIYSSGVVNISTHEVSKWMSDDDAIQAIQDLQAVKAAFGRHPQQGEAPDVYLETEAVVDGVKFRSTIHGAFVCEEIGKKTVDVPAVEAVAAQAASTKEVPVYNCKPARRG